MTLGVLIDGLEGLRRLKAETDEWTKEISAALYRGALDTIPHGSPNVIASTKLLIRRHKRGEMSTPSFGWMASRCVFRHDEAHNDAFVVNAQPLAGR
jgi:hypothetical protein